MLFSEACTSSGRPAQMIRPVRFSISSTVTRNWQKSAPFGVFFRWLERRYLRHLERRREPAAAAVAPPMGIK